MDQPKRFRIYYGDGSTYSGDPFLAPQTDVQIIVRESADSPKGWALLFSKSLHGYYCYRDGSWFVTDDAGFWDYLMCCQGPKKVLFGRTMIRTEAFNDCIRRAKVEGLGDGQIPQN